MFGAGFSSSNRKPWLLRKASHCGIAGNGVPDAHLAWIRAREEVEERSHALNSSGVCPMPISERHRYVSARAFHSTPIGRAGGWRSSKVASFLHAARPADDSSERANIPHQRGNGATTTFHCDDPNNDELARLRP